MPLICWKHDFGYTLLSGILRDLAWIPTDNGRSHACDVTGSEYLPAACSLLGNVFVGAGMQGWHPHLDGASLPWVATARQHFELWLLGGPGAAGGPACQTGAQTRTLTASELAFMHEPCGGAGPGPCLSLPRLVQ